MSDEDKSGVVNTVKRKVGMVGIVVALSGAIAGFTPLLTELRAWVATFSGAGVDDNRSGKFRNYIPVYKTGFDCTLASRNHEKVICTHQIAAIADVKLNTAFTTIMNKLDENGKIDLKYRQGQWATKVRGTSCPNYEYGGMSDGQHDEVGNCLANISNLRTTALYENYLVSE